MAASVRARLSQRAKHEGRPFQELLQHYGLERFLYRLSQNTHGENSMEELEAIVRDVCSLDDDGVVFDATTVLGGRIKEVADYEAVRVKFVGLLDRARIPMQLDIAFGDVIHPAVEVVTYPTLLDHPAPELRVYPRETVIAEKFQAMVHLGTLYSRMKDFYDIWLLSQ